MLESRHAVRPLIAATSAILLLAGCSGDDSDDSDASVALTAYEQALENLPSDTSMFEFRDVQEAEERAGIGDEHDPAAYLEATSGYGWASSLVPYLSVMSDSAWDATDIVWEAQSLTAPDLLTIRRLDDDVDLDAAIGELEKAGYTGASEGAGTLLSAGLNDVSSETPGLYVELGLKVLILPKENLIVSAPDDDGMRAYTEMDESLAGTGNFDRLADDMAFDVEYVYAQTSSQTCDQAAPLDEHENLATPDEAALVLGTSNDGPAAGAWLRFTDEEAAQADVEPRRDLLAEGTTPDGAPYTEYFTTDDISVDGAVETIAIDPQDNPWALQQMAVQRDAPFLACAPA